MIGKSAVFAVLLLSATGWAEAQDTDNSKTATRQRTTSSQTQKPAAPPKDEKKPAASGQSAKSTSGTTSSADKVAATDPTSQGVVAAFNKLVEGIRRTSVDEVTGVYWKSPQLILFNNNGTVTRGWDQVRSNRESSYPSLKEVKLDVRDVRVQMLGRDGAIVTCLWTQSQTAKGVPETASGRMTLAFRRVGNEWKAVHGHTSPDAPDPSRIFPSERVEKTETQKP
jgi:ketosteroid isomerase-like protein